MLRYEQLIILFKTLVEALEMSIWHVVILHHLHFLSVALIFIRMSPNLHQEPSPEYVAPSTGFLSYIPADWVPYAELIRIDKPIGVVLLYLPCIFGTSLGASMVDPITPPARLLVINTIYLLGSFLVRSAGCTWNDLIDRDVDCKVSRTRLRPIARGAISPVNAFLFATFQVALGLLLVLRLLPQPCLFYSIPSIVLTALYPFTKRVTHYPQVVLGFVFSWGIIMAFPSLGLDILLSPIRMAAAGSLYASSVVWIVLCDTIYGAQDRKDDPKAGVNSMAVRHQHHAKILFIALGITQVFFLAITGILMEAGSGFFCITCGGATVTMSIMIYSVDLDDPSNCLWWFQQGGLVSAVIIASGFLNEYVIRLTS